MKPAVALLLLCLCHLGHSDCQSDCLSCSTALHRQLPFNSMVCVLECEGGVSPDDSWDFCRRALLSPVSTLSGAARKKSREEVESLFPGEEEVESGPLLPAAVRRLDHMARALAAGELGVKGQVIGQLNAAYDSNPPLSAEEDYEDAEEEEAGQEEDGAVATRGLGSDAGLSVSKRFGGFVKGRHGYRKLMSPGRSYQKRYGGFIGIRKSARKWNNQKRFSEFLKQYLGMSARATEFNSVSEDMTSHNEV